MKKFLNRFIKSLSDEELSTLRLLIKIETENRENPDSMEIRSKREEERLMTQREIFLASKRG